VATTAATVVHSSSEATVGSLTVSPPWESTSPTTSGDPPAGVGILAFDEFAAVGARFPGQGGAVGQGNLDHVGLRTWLGSDAASAAKPAASTSATGGISTVRGSSALPTVNALHSDRSQGPMSSQEEQTRQAATSPSPWSAAAMKAIRRLVCGTPYDYHSGLLWKVGRHEVANATGNGE
jgi:hypothetical protein